MRPVFISPWKAVNEWPGGGCGADAGAGGTGSKPGGASAGRNVCSAALSAAMCASAASSAARFSALASASFAGCGRASACGVAVGSSPAPCHVSQAVAAKAMAKAPNSASFVVPDMPFLLLRPMALFKPVSLDGT